MPAKKSKTNTKRPRAASPQRKKARAKVSPRPRRPAFYLRRLKQAGGVAVWIVDGAYVRKNIDEEFTNFGHHWSIEEIPRNEVWLDEEAHPDEQRFFVRHALLERKLMSQGADYDSARLKADAVERALRSRAGDLAKVRQGKGPAEARRCLERLWKRLESGVEVWFVNGRLVRSDFDIEFTEGGHDYVYEFVPRNQVWIDDDIHEDERGFVLFHELHERNLMAGGMSYNAAHADASRLEKRYRNHPAELHEALSREGWD